MSGQEPGNRPPWYVFVLAALGIVLVLSAIIGFGPRTSSAPLRTSEPVPQPYRGPDPVTSTTLLGDATSVTVTTTTSAAPARAVAPVTKPTSTTTTATTVTTTFVLPQPGYPTYCCNGGDWGGHHHR
ncbi:hypothetical protein [Kutzneria chonburiensis]|uniref:Uncharacterized protein n=1 Tax=Kutzneria chonburiensis TaxID=1483604 RepID=A0ABV6MJ28_9PSEU|nr:hypothetical protein [Kutzneria chonburiensis]